MHQGIAFRVALVNAGDRGDAEGRQDAFVKAYRALGRFRVGAPFRPWLLRIVANEARNQRRSAGRRAGARAAGGGGLGGRAFRPGRPPSHERRAVLLDGLARLGRDRDVLVHRFLTRARRGGDGRSPRRAPRHRQVADVARARPAP